jgi:tetratricopeptide (TPR) repeat protein
MQKVRFARYPSSLFSTLGIGLFLVLIVTSILPGLFYRNLWALKVNKLLWSEVGLAETQKAKTNLASALGELQRDLAWAPRAESTRKLLGVALFHAGRVKDALNVWQGLPGLTDYLLTWGDSMRMEQHPREALDWYLLALEANPSSSLAWYRVGQFYRSQGDWADALSALRRALQEESWDGLDAERTDAYHQAASLLFRGNHWSGALSLLQEALVVAPDSADLWGDLAWASYQSDGDFDEALIQMKRALDLSPGDEDVLQRAIGLYRLDGQYEEARKLAARARDLDPDSVWLAIAQGQVEFDQGAYTTAIDIFGEAVAMAPETARAHFWLGRAFESDGQWEAAVDSYTTAFELMPEQAEFGLRLGDAYREMGRLEEALATYQEVSVHHPDHPAVQRRLQEASEQK